MKKVKLRTNLKKNLFNIEILFAENENYCNAVHQEISTSSAQEEPQLRPRGVVPGGAGGAMAPPDFGRPQTKPTVNWVLGAGLLSEDQTTQQQLPIHQQNTQQLTPTVNWVLGEDQTTQQPEQLPIYQLNTQQMPINQLNTQQLTPQWYGASSMSSLQSKKSIGPALSNNHQIKSNLLPITLDTSKPTPSIPKPSKPKPSNIPRMESIYPEYWPDQRGKDGHICCYYCGIQSHERSICKTLQRDILENGSDFRAFHPLRGELGSKKKKKKNARTMQN